MVDSPKEPDTASGRTKLMLETVYAMVPDAIITIGRSGIIERAGDAVGRIFGYEEAELVGRNVSMLMPSPHRERHDDYIRRYLETGEARIIGKGRAVQAQRRDGSVFPAYVHVAEVWDGGNPLFMGFIHDLSGEAEARAHEQELRFAMQHLARVASMGELATGLAHELNQPLTAVSQYLTSLAHILEVRPDDRRTAIELIAKATAQAQKAGDIIRSLRRFVGTDKGERRPVPIGDIVENAIRLSLLDSERARIAVRFDRDDTLPLVRVEPVQIEQVLHNLLRNAVAAVAAVARPEIGVTAVRDGERAVRVSVDDNGPGIAPDIKGSLFERFVSGRPEGLGIGLAICRSIIIAHGGRIVAEDRPDGGTRVSFTVPVAP
jgi:two-component system sensor kinase FixL